MSRLSAFMIAALLTACAPTPPNSERIGVVITSWSEPDGFDPIYRRDVASRTYGARTQSPDEPCTYMHVGEYPYASQLGMLPYALAFPVERLEGAYDSFGFYRLSEDGETYVSVFDPDVTVAKADLPDLPGLVRPAIESETRTQRSLWGIDPRDGTNYIEDIWMIGAASRKSPNSLAFPNGIRDLDEISLVASIADFNVLFDDMTPRLPEAQLTFDYKTADVLEDLFGKRVDVRFGSYAPNSGLMPTHEEVGVAMADAGFDKLVVARETTDNNNYANNFMSLGYMDKALCEAGYEGKINYQQVRQIGRAPEYNTALMETLRPHLQRLAPGTDVTILYATYGLPWPGGSPKGPFAQPHPWAKEVYHENAYNNFIAFKRYAEDWYGDRWNLNFNYADKSGDRRVDNYFGYTMYKPDLLQSYGLYRGDKAGQDLAKETRFKTLREQVDHAKSEGREELIVIYSHWLNNTRDTLLAGRILQDFPLNSREDFRNGKYWIDWCELPGSSEPVNCAAGGEGRIHIQLTEAFDRVIDQVAIGYAQRIRGGIERFGQMPEGIGLEVLARGEVTKDGGGVVAVDDGPLAGARLVVAADAHLGAPEDFDWQTHQIFTDPADNMISAWEDFTGYIGTQDVSLAQLQVKADIVSAPVLVGPYRTVVNRPATVTLPFADGEADAGARPFVYNDATGGWDPVYIPAGSKPMRVDVEAGTASFDTQVFGVFALAVPDR